MTDSQANPELQPIRFIGEAIKVHFDRPPALEKTPPCPNNFEWRGRNFQVVTKLNEWHDYSRRGRMASNMRPARVAVAQNRGSWGVGRFYFRVQVEDGRIFDLYYDRAPKSADQRKGSWFIYRELASAE